MRKNKNILCDCGGEKGDYRSKMCAKCRREYLANNKKGQKKLECPVCHRINMKNDKRSKLCRECFLKASRSPNKICPSCNGVKSSCSKKCYKCTYKTDISYCDCGKVKSNKNKFCSKDCYFESIKSAKKFCNGCNKELGKTNVKGFCRNCTSGVNHPNWNHNADSKKRQIERRNFESKAWRLSVYKRDDFECQKCGDRSGKINAHHIFNVASYEEGIMDECNGVTLCIPCHKLFHKSYGKKSNDLNQLLHFINTKKELVNN